MSLARARQLSEHSEPELIDVDKPQSDQQNHGGSNRHLDRCPALVIVSDLLLF